MDDKYSNLFEIVYNQNQVMKNHIENQKEINSTDDQRNTYVVDMNTSTLVYFNFLFYFYFSFLFFFLGVALLKKKSVLRVLFYGFCFCALPYLLFLVEDIVLMYIVPFFSGQYIYI